LFFAGDGVADVGEGLEVDEFDRVVFGAEAGEEFLFVLRYAGFEVVGDAGVEDAGGAGHDIDVVNHRKDSGEIIHGSRGLLRFFLAPPATCHPALRSVIPTEVEGSLLLLLRSATPRREVPPLRADKKRRRSGRDDTVRKIVQKGEEAGRGGNRDWRRKKAPSKDICLEPLQKQKGRSDCSERP
jgi:hypothetical protein